MLFQPDLKDVTDRTDELSEASHPVVEVRVGGSCSVLAFGFPSLCLSQSALVSALCSTGFLSHFMCSFILNWFLNFLCPVQSSP